MRKPLERQFLAGRPIDCVSLLDSSDLSVAQDHCATFLSKFPRLCGVSFLFDAYVLPSSFKFIELLVNLSFLVAPKSKMIQCVTCCILYCSSSRYCSSFPIIFWLC